MEKTEHRQPEHDTEAAAAPRESLPAGSAAAGQADTADEQYLRSMLRNEIAYYLRHSKRYR